MSIVRPFVEDDAPTVAALRLQAFDAPAEAVADADMAAHFVDVFLRPGAHPEMVSLVLEGADGGVEGFLGVLSRRATFHDREVIIGIGTRLMVEAGSNALAGPRLMQRFLGGPQDLSFSDMTNEAGRRLFSGLGGEVAPTHSLEWVMPLRPVRHWLAQGRGPASNRAFRALARPVASVLDRRAGLPEADRPLESRALDAGELPDLLHRVMGHRILRPAPTEAEARWALEVVGRRRRSGTLRTSVLEADDGSAVGWFIYLEHSSRPSRVVQMGWAQGWAYDVLCALLADGRSRGVRALVGKVDRELLEPLHRVHAQLRFANRWTMIKGKDPDLVAAVQDGRAFLSLLEGEWPSSYF